jgi:phosphoribosylformylglycinamidine synthase subunit PurS
MICNVEVRIMLKPSVNDPQGLSIRGALHSLGFGGVQSVRAGKLIHIELEAESREAAEQQVERMCAQLLANPVIETFAFAVDSRAAEAAPGPRSG